MKTTLIDHEIRQKYGLTLTDYCILDSIYRLSKNNKFNGWCVATRQYIAEFIGISTKQVGRIISKLHDLELVELMSDDDDGFQGPMPQRVRNLCRTTDKFHKERNVSLVDKMSHTADKVSHQVGDKMSHYNNSNNNNTDKEKKIVKEKLPIKSKFPVFEEYIKDTPQETLDLFYHWEAYKKEQFGTTYLDIGRKTAIKNLAELAGNNLVKAKKIVDQSIIAGWKGLFELKENGKAKPKEEMTLTERWERTSYE